jgi:hypothetical protein
VACISLRGKLLPHASTDPCSWSFYSIQRLADRGVKIKCEPPVIRHALENSPVYSRVKAFYLILHLFSVQVLTCSIRLYASQRQTSQTNTFIFLFITSHTIPRNKDHGADVSLFSDRNVCSATFMFAIEVLRSASFSSEIA